MTETAGWGVPSFLPPAVAMRMRQDDAHEAVAAREAEAELEAHREELRQRHLGLYAEAAAARGELVSAVALATGQVPGRTVQEILDAGRLAGDRDDVIAMARLHRDGHGDPAPLHVEFGEPQIVSSPVKRSIAARSRRWQEWQAKKKAAEDARRAVEAGRDLGLVDGVTRRPRKDDGDPIVVVSPSRRRGDPPPDNGLRIRGGGRVVGIR